MKNKLFGFGMGVLCTFTFGMAVALLDSTRSYTVYQTDDHTITLKSEHGKFIQIDLENVPEVSCFEHGSIWLIRY